MARGVELGVAYLTIAASTRGMVADIGKALSQGERAAGESGKRIGQAIKKGVESSQPIDTGRLTAKVEADQKRLAAVVEQTSRREEDARRKVAIAEQRLAEVRDSGKASTSQILRAEDQLVQAQNRLKDATGTAAAKQKLYSDALASSQDELKKAERNNKELADSVEKASAKYKGFGGSVRKAMDDARDTIRRSVKGSFDPAEVEAKAAGQRAGGGFASSLKGSLAGLTAYFGAQEIFGGIADSINKAGQLEQSVGAIDSVFKESSKQMHAWAETAATSVGLSQNSYNELATVLGSSLKNAGTPMDQLADKTNGLITLGADLSSMYGGTTKDAIDAISAALRGEMDPIEQYGISLNDAALTAEGLAMGIHKADGAFTTQQKQLIVQSLLMKQSADAQGNFNREQDTFAHKQQVAAAEWENLRTAMGERFLPIATKVMGWVSDTAIPAFEKFSKVTSDIFKAVQDTAPIWGPFAAGIGIVVGVFALWTGVAVPLAAALMAIEWPIVAIVAGIGLLVGAIIYAYNNFEWFRNGVNFVWTWIKDVIAGFVGWWTQVAWPAIMTGLQWLGDKFVWLYQNVVLPVWGFITAVISGFVTWLTTFAIPWVSGALQTLGGWFSWLNDTIIQPVWYAIRVAIAAAVAVIMTIFQGLWWVISNTLGPIFLWLWNSIISPVFTWIAEKIGGFGSWFSTVALPLITGSLDILKIAFQWLWEKISAVFTWSWNKILAFANWFATYILPFLRVALDGVKLAFQWLWEKISAVFTWSWNKIQAFANWFATYILPYIRMSLDALKLAFQWLWEKVSAVWTWISNKISQTWNWIRETVLRPLIGFLKTVLGPAWQWLADKVGQVWDWISDKIRRTWNWTRDNVLSPLMRFVEDDVVGAFTRAKDGIGRVWDKIRDKVKEPVQFVVDTVINGGFIKNYNKVAEKFKVDKLPEVHLPSGFATGGIIPGYARGGILPGYQSKKKDELLTPMRKGEGVLVPEAVRALGADFIHGVNGAANSGGVRAAEEWKKKHGVASGDGHDHGAPAGAYGWAGSSFRTSGSMPPSGGSGIWGSFQAAASRAGAMNFPDKSFLGASTKRAAQAWMGRSALNVNTDGKGPSVTVGTGNAGPWGFNQGSSVQVNPSAPSNMILSILMHEFGHALSLDHTNNGASVMHPAIAGVKSPSGSDYAALRNAWGKPGEGVKTYDVNGGESGFSLKDVLQPIWDATVGKLVNSSMDGLASMFPGNHFVGIGTNAVKQLVQAGFDFIVGNGEGADDGGSSGGDWTGTVKDALKRTGLPVRDDYVNAWKRQIQSESGGNPKAVQGGYTDINSITGDLAKGLVQVIGSTFNAYRDPSLPNDRFNPLANLVAAMNYAKSRYGTSGMLGAIGHGHGYALGGIVGERPGLYDDGGMISGKGLRLIDHQRSTPDYVLTSKQWDAMYQIAERSATNNGTSQQINVTVPEREGISPDTFGARIGEGLAWQLSKMGV